MFRTIEKYTNSSKKSIQIVGGDFSAELGSGYGVERVSVGPHTLEEGNKRVDWIEKRLESNTDRLKGPRNKLIKI